MEHDLREAVLCALWIGEGAPETKAAGLELVRASADLSLSELLAQAPDAIVLGDGAAARAEEIVRAVRASGSDAVIASPVATSSAEVLSLAGSNAALELSSWLEQRAAREPWPAAIDAGSLEDFLSKARAQRRAGVLFAGEQALVFDAAGGRVGSVEGAELRVLERSAMRVVLASGFEGPAPRALGGATVLLLGASDPGQEKAIADGLTALGARVVGVGGVPLEDAITADPAVIVVLAGDLHDADALAMLAEPKLASAALVLVDDAPAARAVAAAGSLAHREIEVRERLDEGGLVIGRVESLGAAKWLKLASRRSEVSTLEVRTEGGFVTISLAGGRIKDATYTREGRGPRVGRDALTSLLAFRFGTVLLGSPEAVAAGRPEPSAPALSTRPGAREPESPSTSSSKAQSDARAVQSSPAGVKTIGAAARPVSPVVPRAGAVVPRPGEAVVPKPGEAAKVPRPGGLRVPVPKPGSSGSSEPDAAPARAAGHGSPVVPRPVVPRPGGKPLVTVPKPTTASQELDALLPGDSLPPRPPGSLPTPGPPAASPVPVPTPTPSSASATPAHDPVVETLPRLPEEKTPSVPVNVTADALRAATESAEDEALTVLAPAPPAVLAASRSETATEARSGSEDGVTSTVNVPSDLGHAAPASRVESGEIAPEHRVPSERQGTERQGTGPAIAGLTVALPDTPSPAAPSGVPDPAQSDAAKPSSSNERRESPGDDDATQKVTTRKPSRTARQEPAAEVSSGVAASPRPASVEPRRGGVPSWFWAAALLGALLVVAVAWAVWPSGDPLVHAEHDGADEAPEGRTDPEPTRPEPVETPETTEPVAARTDPVAVEPAPEATPQPTTDPTPEPSAVEPAQPAASSEDLEALMRELEVARRGADYPRLEELARRALALDPQSGRAAYALGLALVRRNEHDEALEWATRACEWDPRNPLPRLLVGDIHIQRGRIRSARQAWEECLQVEANFPACVRRLETRGQ